MKRTSFLSRGKPLARTTFKPKTPDQRPKRMKSARPKMTPIRASARGEECTLRFPGVCNENPQTTVLCHSNRLEDGKGMGLKAPDDRACYGCSSCHAFLDGGYANSPMPRTTVDAFFAFALSLTHTILKKKGLL